MPIEKLPGKILLLAPDARRINAQELTEIKTTLSGIPVGEGVRNLIGKGWTEAQIGTFLGMKYGSVDRARRSYTTERRDPDLEVHIQPTDRPDEFLIAPPSKMISEDYLETLRRMRRSRAVKRMRQEEFDDAQIALAFNMTIAGVARAGRTRIETEETVIKTPKDQLIRRQQRVEELLRDLSNTPDQIVKIISDEFPGPYTPYMFISDRHVIAKQKKEEQGVQQTKHQTQEMISTLKRIIISEPLKKEADYIEQMYHLGYPDFNDAMYIAGIIAINEELSSREFVTSRRTKRAYHRRPKENHTK